MPWHSGVGRQHVVRAEQRHVQPHRVLTSPGSPDQPVVKVVGDQSLIIGEHLWDAAIHVAGRVRSTRTVPTAA
ncbi:hypothetical protein GCM10009558_009670 [Virgisporangium aurantiacum]